MNYQEDKLRNQYHLQLYQIIKKKKTTMNKSNQRGYKDLHSEN